MLDARDIRKCYGVRRVLDGVSVRVERGRAVLLLGPSGSGKTTLLRIIAGLERADSGEVWIAGACANGTAPGARGIGMMFQDLALWPHMRARRQLEFVLRGRGISRQDRMRRALRLLESLQLEHRVDAYPAQMSGGEQQRLAFARAVITDAPLLLLDEPFANLDSPLRESLLEHIVRRMRERGTAVVLSTHVEVGLDSLGASVLRLALNSPAGA